ncbi:hypothetical protein ACQ4PT_059606 [Festuca glaucescens]
MTVTPGDCPGDRRVIPREPAAGAFPTPSETSEPSPQAAGASSTPPVSLEPSRLGKFWVLADEDSTSISEEEDATTMSAGAFKYLCRSPSPDAGRDLVESASGLARRAEKRLERQRRQRSAAREFASSCKVLSMVSTSPSSADVASPVRPRFPVLEPSTFTIAADDVLGWTVVQRRRRSSDLPNQSCSDPKISENSKTVLLGPFASCDRIREGVPGRPSLRNVARREARRSTAQPIRAQPQKIPNDADIAAGRAWRRKLGFWWARANSVRDGGERVGGGRDSAIAMNNGGGGFGPARGIGPGRGRGDRGDRGDRGGHHGPGRGAGFSGPGNGFGGQPGFSSGRGGGFPSGRQSSFVTGESSGTADARDHGQGQEFSDEFGADFGKFNRGSNNSIFHRNGGNQQYRPRNYGNNFNANYRYGYNGNRSNYNQYRNSGGGNNDAGVQNSANMAGINPELLKEAMQGVVAALAATAQRGGAEGVASSALGAVASAGAQMEAPAVQQPQTVAAGVQQTQPMQVDAMPKADVPNPAKKAKKANNCFRCQKPGHQIDTCTTPVCDICESTSHISSACPLLQAPKPSVTMYGYAIEQLMFFELPIGGSYKPKVDNVKLVKVTVEGDPMSIPEIAECLRRIVPVENFQWEIYNFQNNVFRVKFPNKSEAQRMKTFRTYPVPDRASDLVFEDWSALEDPLYMLPEVWLRVRGIPVDVRTDFLSLWAVGTLFGKTKEVDMVHTRKYKELRMRIGCLDHTLIPETTDVFIQTGFFKLSFEVEPVVVTQLDGNDLEDNGDNNGGGGNDGANDDNMDSANDMDIERAKNNELQGNVNSQKSNGKKTNNAKGIIQ